MPSSTATFSVSRREEEGRGSALKGYLARALGPGSHPGFVAENQPDDEPTPEQLKAYIAAHPELAAAAAAEGGRPDFGAAAAREAESEDSRSSTVPDWARGRTAVHASATAAAPGASAARAPPPPPSVVVASNPFSAFSAASNPAHAAASRAPAQSFDDGANPFASSTTF